MLANKVAIVTGASDGSGKEIALLLGKEGANVVLVARRETILEEVATQIRKSGGQALVVKTDLKEAKQIANVVGKTLETFGRIDILVNVAGMGYYDWIEENTAEEIAEQYQVNIIAMAQLISQVVPTMKSQHSGHIINFASYASLVPIPPLTIYSSTKYAVEGLNDAIRHELAPWGIRVSRIHPSAVNTLFNAKASRHQGINYPYDTLTGVTKERVAHDVIECLKHPKRVVYIARLQPLLDLTVTINNHLPWLMKIIMGIRVKQMWRDDKKHDLQVHH
ncbi:MAG: SDR family NAD(P)-dependent oxidoreductase [Candidatus Woesebacteria bacterium]